MISPKGSQAFGLTVSTVTGLAVFAVVWGFFVWKLDFWYLDKVLGPVFGFISGCLSAYAIYTTGMRDVPLNWVGVGLFLGKPDDTLYENGIQWVSPFGDIITVTPTPVVAVATPANVGGSNKSTPTPKVGVPADVKKWLRLAMVAVTIVICITLIASVARSPDKQTEKAT
ncbi:hypothetical protein EXS57_03605, partial [Candidatus Kaiserbacteria bacterium]|nr:hypothetical protein [Candidatus Kaiserbacteria bacterium]